MAFTIVFTVVVAVEIVYQIENIPGLLELGLSKNGADAFVVINE